MISWIKKKLLKRNEPEKIEPIDVDNPYVVEYFEYPSYYHQSEERAKQEQELIEASKAEIATFNPVTQKILEATGVYLETNTLFFEPTESKLAIIGRDIDIIVKTAIFNEKLKEEINEHTDKK
jgi:hypothetical protein